MKQKNGFLLGKFMPPHAGHLALIEAASHLVDQLTILVCHLPDDPIPGALRVDWIRAMFPAHRVIEHSAIVPQSPEGGANFWPIWREIVRQAHPEPIDLVFAGEDYGLRLAAEIGGRFVPLGNRTLATGSDRLGLLSASAVRTDPAAHWDLLPQPVRHYYRRTVCLHGAESTGKSTLCGKLSQHFGTIWVGEYGRSHCEAYLDDLTMDDLALIAESQQAMIEAAEPWAGPLLISDTDALMTAAWTEMLLGERPAAMSASPKADLYLLLEPDVPWIDDGTRFFSRAEDRDRFAAIVEDVLVDADVPFVRIAGSWDQREATAIAAIKAILP
jgi:HTH-type transcriptional regulator, transcriptional repressor of NAD biosynthesis genes